MKSSKETLYYILLAQSILTALQETFRNIINWRIHYQMPLLSAYSDGGNSSFICKLPLDFVAPFHHSVPAAAVKYFVLDTNDSVNYAAREITPPERSGVSVAYQ